MFGLRRFLGCAVHDKGGLSWRSVCDESEWGQDKIQSHGAVMSVASPDLDGLEIDSKLIHVAAADVWGLSLSGRRDARDVPA
jgi:hypothetical protein